MASEDMEVSLSWHFLPWSQLVLFWGGGEAHSVSALCPVPHSSLKPDLRLLLVRRESLSCSLEEIKVHGNFS